MPFIGDRNVVVEQVDDESWRLREPISYEGRWQCWTVPVDTKTDFASVPRPFVWFLPRYGAYTKAAVLHDYLWRVYVPNNPGDMTYAEADAVFRRAMRELDVPFLRRWIMWSAVRLGALKKPGGRIGWWRESHKVVASSVVAVPIVAPPAILILLSLAVFYVVELIAYAPLKLVTEWRQRRGKLGANKKVVRPAVELSAD